uniref:Uncharacterized protein n=1 Tax=Ixodes ricinus TaxID=34613 RepID=A0A6B0UMZ7_IXORI
MGSVDSCAGSRPRRTFAVVAAATSARATARWHGPDLDPGYDPRWRRPHDAVRTSTAGTIGLQQTVAAHLFQASSITSPDPETPQQSVSGINPFCRELCVCSVTFIRRQGPRESDENPTS